MNENKQKSVSGNNQDELLKSIVEDAKDKNYVSEYNYKYRVGDPNYKLQGQFFCPCIIHFSDGEKWLLYTSTSYRTDRAKEWHWDAFNIKRIDNTIGKAYLVYSESITDTEKQQFLKAKKAYTEKNGFYAIDDVFSERELEDEIQKRGLINTQSGLVHNLVGNSFEDQVVNILNNTDNLIKYKGIETEKASVLPGRLYPLFTEILSKTIKDGKEKILSIDATCDKRRIGRLPSGGNPKTDILIKVFYEDNSSQIITISCKRSTTNAVSIHQYKAEDFASVLDPTNENLRNLIKEFQNNPTIRDFGTDNEKALTEALAPYLDKLIIWALSGQCENANENQVAQYLLFYNGSNYAIHTTEEYAKRLKKIKHHFGTPFSWTYASGQRGRSIQLKCPILI